MRLGICRLVSLTSLQTLPPVTKQTNQRTHTYPLQSVLIHGDGFPVLTFPPPPLLPSGCAPERPQKKLTLHTSHLNNRKPPTLLCIHWAELPPPPALFSFREDLGGRILLS